MSIIDDHAYDGARAWGNRMLAQYHAHVTDAEKDHVISSFSQDSGTVRIVVATIAFGMGIDIPNITNVIHWGVPTSVMSYWQQVRVIPLTLATVHIEILFCYILYFVIRSDVLVAKGSPGRSLLLATRASLVSARGRKKNDMQLLISSILSSKQCLRKAVFAFFQLPGTPESVCASERCCSNC